MVWLLAVLGYDRKMKKLRKVVAVTGPSNSGKTTLIEKIAKSLIGRYKVCIVKNDPSDKARFDVEGKDSHKFFSTGANVAVVSPTRTTLFLHNSSTIDELVELFGDFDYLIVEGLKNLPIPRLAVFRGSLVDDYFPYIEAVATDESVDLTTLPKTLDRLDLNNTDEIVAWIDKNAKEV